MTEMDPRDEGIAALLRRSMAAPVPVLPPEFEQRVMRGLRGDSGMLPRYRKNLLAAYGVVSVVTSAVAMRGQGLDWVTIASAILVPLAAIATIALMRRRRRIATRGVV